MQHIATAGENFIDYGWCSGDQIKVILTLETLLDNLHMQHAEKSTAKAKAQGIGALRLIKQRGIIDRKL